MKRNKRPRQGQRQKPAEVSKSVDNIHANNSVEQNTQFQKVENDIGEGDLPVENLKFKEACERIRQNAAKYIGDGMEQDLSSSEDELDDSGIILKTFQKYQDDGASDLKKTQEFLQDALTSGAVVCLICIESIKRNDPIWSCRSCYCMLHVPCIQKWAKDSLFHQSSNADESKPSKENKWCCPKCRHDYKSTDLPSHYFCFCGKVENPPYDPWNLPHACGQTCEKKLKPFCGHDCLLLCHPGPCPPCPKTVQKSCHCSKSKPVTRRCSNKEWSCGKTCNSLLSCKQHHCEEPCHGDECPPCSRQSEQKCFCGNEKRLQPCNDPTWHCQKVCIKQLECGNHTCLVACHGGECSPCPKSGARPCPCTKKVVWLPCTEEVTPCGDTCDKLLECELHTCNQRCHNGSCGACLQMRLMKCRCGQRVKSVPCCKEFLCDIKCKQKRDCGKHNCNRKCCTGNCPPCEAPCLRTLNCGSHKCQSRCHAGPCFPCRETVDIMCNCSNTKISIPCGRKNSSVPPRCNINCKMPPDCHHPTRHWHRCHFGACPPCRVVCGKTHLCGHTCPTKCHSAVLTKIETKKKKEGPWDLLNCYKMELVCKPCPPCVVPVPLTCLGGHVTHDFFCHEVKPWSCGRPCGRNLVCGNHLCELQCHEIKNAPDPTQQSDSCNPCDKPCDKKRPVNCTHECVRSCHANDCDPCTDRVKMRCHCQLNFLYIICDDWSKTNSEKRDELMSCKNTCPKELSCGHRCPLTCHKGLCPNPNVCKRKVTIRCPCKRLKKEVQCVTQTGNVNSLTCNEQCIESQKLLKAAEQAAEEKKRTEEEKKLELELKEFMRKTEGKKKKRKKQKEVKETEFWLKKHMFLLMAIFVCILGLLSFLYFAEIY